MSRYVPSLVLVLSIASWPAHASAQTKAAAKAGGSVQKSEFGRMPDGTEVDLYTLSNGGITAKVTNYGAILTELIVPDRNGKAGDVVLGFKDLKGYLAGHPFFGSTVGRVANRVAGGKFTIDGKTYTLAVNNGPNSLHGGTKGFDKAVWKAEVVPGSNDPAVRFSHLSPDGDEGYPGNLSVSVTYTITNQDELRIDYTATTDKATPINLTNHSYFNLGGPASGSVLEHELMINADSYTMADETLIPTGKIAPVEGTPLDFRKPTPIGARIDQVEAGTRGYDHNFVLKGDGKEPRLAARVRDPKSGRVMEVLTTEPGVQLYTGNHLDGSLTGKGGVSYKKHGAFCLETEHFPDSINHPEFPSTVLRPGETYRQTTIYRFSAR